MYSSQRRLTKATEPSGRVLQTSAGMVSMVSRRRSSDCLIVRTLSPGRLSTVLLGDVVIGLQRPDRSPRSSRCSDHRLARSQLPPVPGGVHQLSLPAAGPKQLRIDVLQRRGKIVRMSAWLTCPSASSLVHP